MNTLMRFALVTTMVGLAACNNQNPVKQDEASRIQVEPEAKGAQSGTALPINDLDAPEVQAGMFRWSSVMSQGICSAGVSNKTDDNLSISHQSSDCGSSDEGVDEWDVYLTLSGSSPKSKISTGNLLQFVSGDKVAQFPYEMKDGELNILKLGMDGFNNMFRLREMLSGANGIPICVEFPQADYRTCFSTKGAKEALM